ncbi:hypothetical protein ES705_16441 [subsurface metagenome]
MRYLKYNFNLLFYNTNSGYFVNFALYIVDSQTIIECSLADYL